MPNGKDARNERAWAGRRRSLGSSGKTDCGRQSDCKDGASRHSMYIHATAAEVNLQNPLQFAGSLASRSSSALREAHVPAPMALVICVCVAIHNGKALRSVSSPFLVSRTAFTRPSA